MTIPIFLLLTAGLRCPKESKDRLRPNLAANLVRAIRAVKKKMQAFAAFLGVWAISRDVVGGCCNHNTILSVSGRRGGCIRAKKHAPAAFAPAESSVCGKPCRKKRESRGVSATALQDVDRWKV
jgi:hypothetical protein